MSWLKKKNENCCPHCGQKFFPGTGVIVNKHTGRFTKTLEFCSEKCAQDAYLKHLRSTEGL